jgi:hypothetical protein
VSVFRPAAKVTSPDGQEWEIYAHKLRVATPGPPDADAPREPLLARLVRFVPRVLARLARLATDAIRAARSDEWTVDAVSHMPRRTTYTWTTTTEYKGQVLAQVEGNLARGDIPQRLTNAVYRGERRSAR